MRYAALEIARDTAEVRRAAMLAFNAVCDAAGEAIGLMLTGEDEEPSNAEIEASDAAYEIDQSLEQATLALKPVLLHLGVRDPDAGQPAWAQRTPVSTGGEKVGDTIIWPDHSVTYWSVYQQEWRYRATSIPDHDLAALPADERAAVVEAFEGAVIE